MTDLIIDSGASTSSLDKVSIDAITQAVRDKC